MEFIEGLLSLGINRNVAKLIRYLKNVDQGSSSRDIEMATGIRQPEVSIAMGTLRKLGWIYEREVKNQGKGRPMRLYVLRVTINEIIEHYEAEKNQESVRTIEAIKKLKELSSV